MTFNIHQSVFDRDGMPREKVAEQCDDSLRQKPRASQDGS
jgi:hypothetical protein